MKAVITEQEIKEFNDMVEYQSYLEEHRESLKNATWHTVAKSFYQMFGYEIILR